MSRKDYRAGGKIGSRHGTVIEPAAVLVDCAQKLPEVTKIIIGLCKSIGASRRKLKFKEIPVGWEVVVYGNKYVQTIYLHTSQREAVKAALESIF